MSTFCAACGSSVGDDERFCRQCGAPASAGPGFAVAAPPAPAGPSHASGKAIASLVFGLFIFFFPFSIVAVILGHLSLSEIRKSAGRLKGDGIAIAGLVLGYLGVAGVPIVLIIAAIAIPNLLRARMAANESSAVASVRTILTAEITYSSSHPQSGYTCALSDLKGDGLIEGAMANGPKNGYMFELMTCVPEVEGGPNTKYRVMAYPVTANQTGVRAFCSDESGVIRVDSEGSGRNCLASGQPLQ
jgi:type IV pilus assembly protein PilA